MEALRELSNRADQIWTFNAEFDLHIIKCAEARLIDHATFSNGLVRCIMNVATPILNLPPTDRMLAAGRRAPKRPSLAETYRWCFGENFAGAHGALADSRAAARVLIEF